MRPKEQNWSSVATRREVPAAVRSSERQGNRLPLLSGNSPAHTLTQPRSLASGSRRDLFLLLRATELLFSPTLCEPADGSTPGFSVLHCLLEFVQTHVHQVCDAIQPFILCHPLLLLPSIFPSIRVFSSELALLIRWQRTGVSASVSVLPMKIQS